MKLLLLEFVSILSCVVFVRFDLALPVLVIISQYALLWGVFLEHHRLFYFRNGGNESLYLSSADWMPRNLNERVELMIPIEDKRHKERGKKVF